MKVSTCVFTLTGKCSTQQSLPKTASSPSPGACLVRNRDADVCKIDVNAPPLLPLQAFRVTDTREGGRGGVLVINYCVFVYGLLSATVTPPAARVRGAKTSHVRILLLKRSKYTYNL